jgi:hypothetical protein
MMQHLLPSNFPSRLDPSTHGHGSPLVQPATASFAPKLIAHNGRARPTAGTPTKMHGDKFSEPRRRDATDWSLELAQLLNQ